MFWTVIRNWKAKNLRNNSQIFLFVVFSAAFHDKLKIVIKRKHEELTCEEIILPLASACPYL